jgi:hypothetical protein
VLRVDTVIPRKTNHTTDWGRTNKAKPDNTFLDAKQVESIQRGPALATKWTTPQLAYIC